MPGFGSTGATPTQILLVHCGRLSVEKHADRSIDALAALCDAGVDARLVIAGEGPLRARLERKATGLPIDFTGFISDRHAVAGLLASADVALAPGPHETFGLAALESLACGTPAVVSRTSALTEIITADSGACADNRPEAIAHAVRTIVSRPERHRRRCAPPRRNIHLATGSSQHASNIGRHGRKHPVRRHPRHRIAVQVCGRNPQVRARHAGWRVVIVRRSPLP